MIDEITRLRAAEAGLPAAESHPDPMLVCFPLRSDWERAGWVAVEVVAYPAPEVSTRDGVEPRLWPSSLLTMQRFAAGRGWAVGRQYSRGCLPHAKLGTPGPVKDWYGLRMRSVDGRRRAWMVHDGTAWKSMSLWGFDVPPLAGELGVTAVKEWVSGPEHPAGWRDALSASLVGAAVMRQRRAAELAARKRAAGLGAGSGEAL